MSGVSESSPERKIRSEMMIKGCGPGGPGSEQVLSHRGTFYFVTYDGAGWVHTVLGWSVPPPPPPPPLLPRELELRSLLSGVQHYSTTLTQARDTLGNNQLGHHAG